MEKCKVKNAIAGALTHHKLTGLIPFVEKATLIEGGYHAADEGKVHVVFPRNGRQSGKNNEYHYFVAEVAECEDDPGAMNVVIHRIAHFSTDKVNQETKKSYPAYKYNV